MYMFFEVGILIPFIGITYFSFFVWRIIKTYLPEKKNKVTLATILFIVTGVSVFANNIFTLYTMVYLHALVISFIFEIVYIWLKRYKTYSFLFTSGILTITLTCLLFTYGYYNMHHIIETKYTIESSKVEQLRVLQLTDIHMSNSLSIEKLEKEKKKFNLVKADIVVFTGDIFDERTSKKDMEEACKILGSIYNTKGIYFVYGNHDANNYSQSPAYVVSDLESNLLKNNITILNDEVITIAGVTLIGRGDANGSRYGKPRKEISELITNVNPNDYIIVLDHQPLDIDKNKTMGVDLQLSGHTHGGQLFPSGFMEEILTGNLVYGKRTLNDFTAITSSGVAGWGYPIKTGAPSEYVVIDIK